MIQNSDKLGSKSLKFINFQLNNEHELQYRTKRVSKVF